MAVAKKTEVITIQPVEKLTAEITIVGETPLIVHAWSEKAKREMLDKQTKKTTLKGRAPKRPVVDFIRSMYWLDGQPEIPDDATDEDCIKIFDDAIAKGARFGFPAVAIKKAATSAAYRQGWTKDKVTANGTFWLCGLDGSEFVEIETDEPPIMREDMVKIDKGSTPDIRYRGEFRNWKCRFKITYLKNGIFNLENLISMINLGGFSCGLGEWRVEKGGLSGAFSVETK